MKTRIYLIQVRNSEEWVRILKSDLNRLEGAGHVLKITTPNERNECWVTIED